MSLPFTSVVSYHTSEYGCGVAKFGKLLAEKLGVPFISLDGRWGAFPLVSLKWSEVTDEPEYRFSIREYLSERSKEGLKHGVFWHDRGDQSVLDNISSAASVIYHADPSLGPNGLWCPSLLTPSKPRTVKLFSFGMAHKLQTQHYAKVRQLLDAAGLDYQLRVSVGLHEGTSLSDATQHFDALYEVMGRDKVTILGILSDDAVQEELHSADYVLAFFKDGVRLNNTTVHAALDAGCDVITNGTPILNTMSLDYLDAWPSRYNPCDWEHLITRMTEIYAATQNRQLADQR
jgi:hypothetical protein